MKAKTIVLLVVIGLFLLTLFGPPMSEQYSILQKYKIDIISETINDYFFGAKNLELRNDLNTYGTQITFLMIWLIIFTTFGDIIENFSSFSEEISWIIATGLTVIASFTGVIEGLISKTLTFLVKFGTWAILIELIIAILFFVLLKTFPFHH